MEQCTPIEAAALVDQRLQAQVRVEARRGCGARCGARCWLGQVGRAALEPVNAALLMLPTCRC